MQKGRKSKLWVRGRERKGHSYNSLKVKTALINDRERTSMYLHCTLEVDVPCICNLCLG